MLNSDIQKMIFIYNALNEGWIVKKIKDNEYEFLKKKKDFNYSKNIFLNKDFLVNFINNNLKLENI